ncbi:MAG: isochorismatase family protein [Mycobacteriales bacterium]
MDRYDAATALLVVDMQNDFADPGGTLFVPGGDELIAPINSQVAAAVEAGAMVVYTLDWHPPSTPHFAKDGGIWPVHCVAGSWGADLHPQLTVASDLRVRKGTGTGDGYSAFAEYDSSTAEGSAQRPSRSTDVATSTDEGASTRARNEGGAQRSRRSRDVVASAAASPALPTRLGGLLAEAGVERLVVVGLAADYCVRATSLDGRRLGYDVLAPWSLTRPVDRAPGDGDAARRELVAAGVTVA